MLRKASGIGLQSQLVARVRQRDCKFKTNLGNLEVKIKKKKKEGEAGDGRSQVLVLET